MNSRIYSKEVFQQAINDYLNKKYCPYCYSDTKVTHLSYSALDVSSTVRNVKRCECCNKVLNENEVLNKQEVRNKKIDEVLKK